ncbi:MAG: helix-turn-helix domain-containing protein, partial [Acetobacteraceae bacterium]
MMGKAVTITRQDLSATELRKLAAIERDGAVVRRLLAIALILEGASREEAARCSGMERQTLRDWVHRYNTEGVAGLRSRWGAGRPPTLSEAQMEDLRGLVLAGPDLDRHPVIRWRCVD